MTEYDITTVVNARMPMPDDPNTALSPKQIEELVRERSDLRHRLLIEAARREAMLCGHA